MPPQSVGPDFSMILRNQYCADIHSIMWHATSNEKTNTKQKYFNTSDEWAADKI